MELTEGKRRTRPGFELIGTAVAQARRRRGWSQRELADRLNMTPSYIGAIEQARRHPMKWETIAAFAEALEAEPASLTREVAGPVRGRAGTASSIRFLEPRTSPAHADDEPAAAEVWLLRARTRKAAGDYEEAEADFLRAAKLYPPNTQRGRTLIETAEAATQSGQLAKAKSLLDRAETQCDLDSLARNEAATLRGWVYMDEGRVREAAAILRSVAKDAEQPGAWRDPRNEGRTHSLLGKVRIELEWNAAPPTELRPSSPGALAGAQERLRIAARELERADPLWHISNGLWATIADILAAPHAGTDRKSELENIRSAYGRDSHRAQAELALARYRLIRDPADLKARDLYESALTVFVEEGKHPKRVATIGLDLAAALRQKGKVRAREIADLLVLTLLAHPYPGHRTSRAAATKLGLALTEIPNIDDYLESLKGRVDAGEGHFRWLQLLPPVEKRGLILAKVSEVARRKRR